MPSIEDVILGAIPGLPKVHVHNPVIAYEVGDDFMKHWFDAAAGKLEPSSSYLKAPFRTKKSRRKVTGRRWGRIPDWSAHYDERVD